MDRRGAAEDAQALIVDADQARDGAAPVSADHVLRADAVLAPCLALADHRGRPLLVLAQGDQLVPEADPPGRELLGAVAKHRLQADLGEVHLPRRARRRPVLIGAAGAPALDAPDPPAVAVASRDARIEGRRGHRIGRRTAPLDLLRGPYVLEDLHRPQVQHVRLRQPGGRRQCADEQRLHAQAGEKHRGREARSAAADDQDRHLLVEGALLV